MLLIPLKVRLEVLKLHLELLNQPGMTFGAVAILLTPKFGDLKPQVTVRRRMIWNMRPDFGAESSGSSGLGYAA